MPLGWSRKRKRQYEHVKESEVDRGNTQPEAEEIAARTVNKERARKGETRDQASTPEEKVVGSKKGTTDSDSDDALSKAELYAEAKRRNIDGRSAMTKAELRKALGA